MLESTSGVAASSVQAIVCKHAGSSEVLIQQTLAWTRATQRNICLPNISQSRFVANAMSRQQTLGRQ
jgi:hypothetical protein